MSLQPCLGNCWVTASLRRTRTTSTISTFCYSDSYPLSPVCVDVWAVGHSFLWLGDCDLRISLSLTSGVLLEKPVRFGREVGRMWISLSLAVSQDFLVCILDPPFLKQLVAFVLSNVFNDVLLSKPTRQPMSHHLLLLLDPLGSCPSWGPLSVGFPLWDLSVFLVGPPCHPCCFSVVFLCEAG